MARQRLRGNTMSSAFPLLSSYMGQTVIAPAGDQQPGAPQVMFLENVMPMANGLQSVGYQLKVNNYLYNDFDQAMYLRDMEELKTLYVPANGKNYLYDFIHQRWTSQPRPIAQPNTLVSIPNVKGRQFVFYAFNNEFLEWDGIRLKPVAFLGLMGGPPDVDSHKPSDLLGFVAANAYNVGYTEREIIWSSIIDPTDFRIEEGLITGSGSSDVLALKGKIIVCTSISDGFLIYTTSNVISATYTGNIRFPWVFKELSGSAGIVSADQVTRWDTSFPQYGFTVSGMQAFAGNQAAAIWPELSEFISERRYEFYDYKKKEIVEVDTNDALLTQICLAAERYVIISYGDNVFTHALIFDLALKRWGKLKFDHVDCFSYIDQRTATFPGKGVRYKELIGSYADQKGTYFGYGHLSIPIHAPVRYYQLFGSYEDQKVNDRKLRYIDYNGIDTTGLFINTGEEPYKSLGFLKANGEIFVVNFDLPLENEMSVLYLGKYQLTRSRLTDLYEVWVENMSGLPATKVAILPSLDGANFNKTVYPMKDKNISKGKLQKYLCNETATSLTVRLEGSFDPHSVEFVFGVAGYR